MSLCEHHPKYDAQSDTTTSEKVPPKLIQDELVWGLSYRDHQLRERVNSPIQPKKSPIDIPFKLCREKQSKRKRKTPKDHANTQLTKKTRKISLLERSVLSQSKYMEQLSLPNPKYEEPPLKKPRMKCQLEPCSPRLVQLSVPTKRRVLANWKDYHRFVPAEIVVRYQKLLHTDKNLEPREAKYHYKKLDRAKRNRLKKRKQKLKKLREKKLKGDQKWLKDNIEATKDAILNYIRESPSFALNYKQLLISDGILSQLENRKVLRRPNRRTKNYFKKSVIEIGDKLALWVDTLSRFVDIQAVESEEDIPPLTISSLGEVETDLYSDVSYSEEGEGEGEDEEESEGEEGEDEEETEGEEGGEGEEEKGASAGGRPGVNIWDVGHIMGPEDEEGTDIALTVNELTDNELTDNELTDEGEGGIFSGIHGGIDEDVLDKLIEILSNTSDDFLDRHVDDEKLPAITYRDILEKMKELKQDIVDEDKKPFLESVMVEWAMHNDPDKVDKMILNKIHETSVLINKWLNASIKKDEGVSEEGEEEREAEEGEEKEGEDEEYHGESEHTEEPVSGEAWSGHEEEDEFHEGLLFGDLDAEEKEFGEDEEFEDGEEEEEGGVGGILRHGGLPPIEDVDENDEQEAEGEKEEQDERKGTFPRSWSSQLRHQEEMRKSDDTAKTDVTQQSDEQHPSTLMDFDAITVPKPEVPEEQIEAPTDEEHPPDEEDVTEITEPIQPTPVKPSVRSMKPGAAVPIEEGMAIIKGHWPSVTMEHSPSTVCCLSLKTWAVWLLEITQNAHSWTKWIQGVIQQVREFAATVRGDVVSQDGGKKKLYKSDWRKFIADTEENIIAWRQYSAHVKDLSASIVENFHGKRVNCCPKCLQDHLIKNVVTAHETLQALTEAMNCAEYWHRSLDEIVKKTVALTDDELTGTFTPIESEESDDIVDLEELQEQEMVQEEESGDSIYEIEELEIDPSSSRASKS